MLQKLHIRNYAIIDKLVIEFSENLNIITGETGAGKSILLGALGLILGERANPSALRNKEKKCVVEGWFDVSAYNVKEFFELHDLDYDITAIIRREITPSGKSRAFINDTPVSLSVLKQLTSKLVNLLAQHQTLYLNNTQFQLEIVDALAEQNNLVQKYQTEFKQYQNDCAKLKEIETKISQQSAELDYLNFQLEELESLNLSDANEQTNIETELQQLNNVDNIKSALSESAFILSEGENNVIEALISIQKKLDKISSLHANYEDFSKRIESSIFELQDVASEINNKNETIENNPNLLNQLQARLDLIIRLQNKHQVHSINDLLSVIEQLNNKKSSIENADANIQELKNSIAEQEKVLKEKAKHLSIKRKATIPIIEQRTDKLLSSLGMENAKLKVQLWNEEALSINGFDSIEWQFSANKGMPFVALKKVASGGELSRLMLSIQSILAGSMAMPTLIFDEIDTGISGEVAKKVGRALKQLAQSHQLICITHLPQIASCSENHYFVYKQDVGEQTVSSVKRLSKQEHIYEIGQMIDGKPPGETALNAAKDLVLEMVS